MAKQRTPLTVVPERTQQAVQNDYSKAAGEAGVKSFTIQKMQDELDSLHRDMQVLTDEFNRIGAENMKKQNELNAAQGSDQTPAPGAKK